MHQLAKHSKWLGHGRTKAYDDTIDFLNFEHNFLCTCKTVFMRTYTLR